eukprot:gnl/MRDRNA2_/MRDRNA2_96863_c0_seq1.p1 gnl/MRDRNA2_/MRDRNA2_96863_c0~~gnl/MRDRNA2_/MRDRNA2_96863_c0_seq1.p1  ORF type:complete len:722 (+),score=185.33 gnl/MRDRNA2_/MRDRNA2_96863_c0_seq1:118-2283(+)
MAKAAVANPLDKDDIDWQAMELRSACQSGDLETAQELLEDQANPRYCPPGACWTILSLASHQGHSDIVGFFAGRRGAPKIEDVDAHGYQAIMWAAHSGDAECLRILIDKQADVNCASETGTTPLMMAAAEGHTDSIRLLLDAEADLNAVDKNGWRAVQKAAWWGHQKALAELLLEQTPSKELMRNLFTACKLQGHAHCKDVLVGTSGPRAYSHVKCALTLHTALGHRDATKELRAALAQTLIKHGVLPEDIAMPALVETGEKSEGGKPVKTAEVDIRVITSSVVGIMSDLREALNEAGSPIRKHAKLGVEPSSSKVDIAWPLEKLAKAITEKFPAYNCGAVDLADAMKVIEESIMTYTEVMSSIKETDAEHLTKIRAQSSKARYFVEKDLPPPEEPEDGAAENVPEPVPEYESLLVAVEEGRAQKYWEDWCEHGQSVVHASRHAILQAIFTKSQADKAEKAEETKKRPVEGEELLIKKPLNMQMFRKKAQSAHTKMKTILAPGTPWAMTVMNDLEKIPLDSEDRQISPEKGCAQGGTALDFGFKSTELIEEKARSYAGIWHFPGMDEPQYSMVLDMCTITVVYPTIDALMQGVKELSSSADMCWFHNGFRSPSILGYSEIGFGIRVQMPGGESFICQVLMTVRPMHDAKMEKAAKTFEDVRNSLAGLGELPPKTQDALLRFIMSSLEETEGEGRRMAARYNPAPQPKKQQTQAKKSKEAKK